MSYTKHNANTWDEWAKGGCPWSIPCTAEDIQKARAGDWGVTLACQVIVPREWFAPFLKDNSLAGCKLLGLACGGGQQMPIFASLGADCTVLDYSTSQLQAERDVAAREGYAIEIVQADMTQRLPFEDASFDLIFHPVSNCYIEDVQHVWDECARVLRPGGVLLAGCDNGINFLFEEQTHPPRVVNKLPFNTLRLSEKEQKRKLKDNRGAFFFSHTMEEQIGGQLKAGFRLTHLLEDRDLPGHAAAIAEYYPQYILTRALKEPTHTTAT